jgi:hypothetical protein
LGQEFRQIPSVPDTPLHVSELPQNLCLTCGLCCNGVLFKDVVLQPADARSKLAKLGLPLRRGGRQDRFPQPCAALEGCSCRIYTERPARCQQFECLLFQSVAQGQTTLPAALRRVRQAQQKAERVRRLLRALGDVDETVALSIRFRRMRVRFEKGLASAEDIDRFGELTLATHDLNLLLSEAFYRA